MDIRSTHDDGATVLQPVGRLNMVAAPALRAAIDRAVDSGHARIVVDLEETSFIDSSGLGALVAGLKKTRQHGGDLRIARAQKQLRTVLSLTNLDRILRPHNSVEDARHGW
jgi:anti-sigma B factor antagonist